MEQSEEKCWCCTADNPLLNTNDFKDTRETLGPEESRMKLYKYSKTIDDTCQPKTLNTFISPDNYVVKELCTT